MGSDMLEQAKQRALKSIKDTYEKETSSIKNAYEKETKSLTRKKHHKGPVGKKDDLVDDLVRDLAATVGFFSEISDYRKAKKMQRKEAAATAEEPTPTASNDEPTPTTFNDEPPPYDTLSPTIEAEAQSPRADTDTRPIADQCKKPGLLTKSPPTRQSTSSQESGESSTSGAKQKKQKQDFAAAFLERHELDPIPSPKADIRLPVVLPQRRPKERARGFVRAYSPALENAGISQEVFLDFIDTLNQAIKPNPWIEAINLAGVMPFPIPDPIVAFVLFEAVEQAVTATMEAQSRHRSRSYLDKINAEYFLPRDLIAIVITWRPEDTTKDSEDLAQPVDFAAMTAPAAPQQGIMKSLLSDTINDQKKKMKKKKTSSDEADAKDLDNFTQKFRATDGSFNAVEMAPLIFPSQEDVLAVEKLKADGKQMNKFDRGEAWMDNYLDRRAQWKWAERNPEMAAAMQMPKATCTSKYADPNHPAASGDIVAFATKGRYSTRGKIQQGEDVNKGGEESEVDEKEREKIRKREQKDERYLEKKRVKEMERKPRQGLAGLLQQNLLYLVVVDVPESHRRNPKVAAQETGDSSLGPERGGDDEKTSGVVGASEAEYTYTEKR